MYSNKSGSIRETNTDIKEIEAEVKMAEILKLKGCDYGCVLQSLNKKGTNATPGIKFPNPIP